MKENINENEKILNTRFDICNNSIFLNKITMNDILKFIQSKYKLISNKNLFFTEQYKNCYDNLYMGNVRSMYKLINHFHNNLDIIISKYDTIKNQERLVFYENNSLFK